MATACSTSPQVKRQRYFDSGNRYFDQGKYAQAIIEYRNAIEVDATFGPARKRLAQAYAGMGNDQGAFEEFVRAADLLPNDVEAQLSAGNVLLAGKKAQEALTRADAALKLQPENVEALVLRGNALSGLRSFDDAITSIQQAITIDPKRGATYTDLGSVELARGHRDQAEAAFLKAIQASPKDIRSRLALANFYWSLGRTSDAGRAFDEALKVDPGNLQANRFMASFKYGTGHREDAEPYFRRIAELSDGPDGTVALADYLLDIGRPREAIASIEHMKIGRDAPEVIVQLARAYSAAGDRATAYAVIDRGLKSNKDAAVLHLQKGRLYRQDGRADEALAEIQLATTLEPDFDGAQFALGELYASRGDGVAAEAAFREVLRVNPGATNARVRLAALQAQSRPDESVRTADEAARQDPRSLAARLTLVHSLIQANNLVRAEGEIADLRAAFPNAAAVYTSEATLALLRKDTARARAAIERAEALDADAIDTVGVAIAYELAQHNPSGARSRLEARLKRGTTPALLVFAGRTYLTLNELAEAENALRQAIDRDPSNNDAYAILGSLYVSQQRVDEALRQYEALAERQAKPVGARTIMGILLERQGKIDAAIQQYDKALAMDPGAGVAANNLAWILAQRGEDLNRALQFAQAAVASSPETPEVLDTLGWVYYKKDLATLAIPYFRRCIERAPTVPEYHLHLGLALLTSGDTAAARASLQRALDLPGSADTTAQARHALESAK